MLNFSCRNILQTLERDGCFPQVLPACMGHNWVWCAAVFIPWLSGKQAFSPDGGEVGTGEFGVTLLGRTCFSQRAGYSHVVCAKLLWLPVLGFGTVT